jgi:hypothetical protein
MLAVALLGVAACTENELDESDADVILEILGITNPSVTGQVELGTCSVSGNDCLTIDDCPIGEFCDLPVVPGECLITEWSVSLSNKPLNEGGVETPFNDIVVNTVTITYTTQGGAMYAPARTVQLGTVIQASSNGTVTFAPITFDDLSADNTTINLGLLFSADTVSGNAVSVFGGTGAQLFIEDCIP